MTPAPEGLALHDPRAEVLRPLPQGLRDACTLGAVAEYLGHQEPAVCEAALNMLVQSATPAAAEAAAERLRSRDPAERARAMRALQGLGEVALNTLVMLLGDVDEDIRKYAVDTLAAIGDPAAIPALSRALQDPDVNVAAAAAEGLGTIGSPQAIAPLEVAMHRGPDWVRISALHSLGAIGGKAALEAICEPRGDASTSVQAASVAAAATAGLAEPLRAAQFLTGLMAGQAPGIVDAALIAFGSLVHSSGGLKLDEPRRSYVLAAAAERLTARRADLRVAAIQVLANRGAPDAQANPAIASLAWNDPAPSVRNAAAQALAPLRGAGQTELVLAATSTSEPAALRRMALHLLADRVVIGPDERWALVELARSGPTLVLRLAALRVLLVLGDERAVELGIAMLGENDLAGDRDAQTELEAFTLADLLPLLRAVLESSEPVCSRLFAALLPLERARDLCVPNAQAMVRRASINAAWQVRAHTLQLLVGCPAPWARDVIRAGCVDTDARVRVHAVQAMGRDGMTDRGRRLAS